MNHLHIQFSFSLVQFSCSLVSKSKSGKARKKERTGGAVQCSAGRQVVQVMQGDKKEEEEKEEKNEAKTKQNKKFSKKKLLVVGMDFIQYHSNCV